MYDRHLSGTLRLNEMLAAVRSRSQEFGKAGGWRETPFVVGYLAIAWLVFAVLAAADFPNRRALADPFGVALPSALDEVPHMVSRLVVAPFINAGVAQLLYVTALLWVVGRHVERRIGSVPVITVFIVSTWAGGLVAAVLVNTSGAWQPGALDGVIEEAWTRRWNGGSAGCYGLLAIAISWSARPFLGVAATLSWEAGLTLGHLQSFTPAFHLGAFACGLLFAQRWTRTRCDASPSRDATQTATGDPALQPPG